MKKFIPLLLFALLLSGCQKSDEIDPGKNPEVLCRQVNANLTAIQSIVTALQNYDYVESVSPITEEGKEVGSTIKFSKSDPVAIYCREGHIPVISVRQDADKRYYWSLDGEFIVVDDRKIQVEGNEIPQLKIASEYWHITYDNGVNWTKLNKATGESYTGVVELQVTQDTDYVYLTLYDSTIIRIAKSVNKVFIDFVDPIVKAICVKQWDRDGDGQLSCGEAAAVTDTRNAFWSESRIATFHELRFFTGLQKIGSDAFRDCRSLTGITIPANVTSIGESAFFFCKSLTDINIPSGVTSIEGGTFAECSSLSGITIPDGVTSIGAGAFSGCTSLTDIIIPGNVTWIGDDAFGGCSSLIDVTIPDKVTSIGKSVFQNCTSLKSITLGKGLDSTGTSTFFNCTNLTSVSIPDNVTSIGDGVFSGCSRLTSIQIPDMVTSIGAGAFESCGSLTDIVIPETVIAIGNEAFEHCISLTSITIPSNLTSISGGVFAGCSKLTSITIPDKVTSIGALAFIHCYSLTNITIPDKVTSIGNRAFEGCSSLTCIAIPDNVTSLGTRVFTSCSKLAAFSGTCVSDDNRCLVKDGVLLAFAPADLTAYTISNNVTSIGDSAFQDCSKLFSINIPDNVTSIGDWAFLYCVNLTSIVISDSVTSIGNCAFQDCHKLPSITIPDRVTSIGASAFGYCASLKNIYCKPTIPPTISYDSFHSIASNAKIYVPAGSIDVYKSANIWKNYSGMISGYTF